jgi:hypothetical protein
MKGVTSTGHLMGAETPIEMVPLTESCGATKVSMYDGRSANWTRCVKPFWHRGRNSLRSCVLTPARLKTVCAGVWRVMSWL